MEDRVEYRLLGMLLFSFEDVLPFEDDVTYTNIYSELDVLSPYNGKDITITEDDDFIVFDGPNVVTTFRLEEDESFRDALIIHLHNV